MPWLNGIIPVIAFILLLFCPVKVEYRFDYRGEIKLHRLKIGLLFFYKNIDLSRNKASKKRKPFKDLNKKYGGLIKMLLRHAKPVKVEVKIGIGFMDAFINAIVVGLAQSLGYSLIAQSKLKKKELLLNGMKIYPIYNRQCLECFLFCIAKISLVNIICVMLRHLIVHKRSEKNAPN